MYAVAINGSPRIGGNTEVLLKKVLEPIERDGWETELVQIGGKNIRGCLACMKCTESGDMRCAVKNDILNEVLEKMVKADAIILGSSTYFSNVTAEMKALIDRAGLMAIRNGYRFSGKIGAAVSAVRRGGAVLAFDAMNHMFQINQMIVPGSSYWNFAVGLKKGDVEGDMEGQKNMEHLGKTIAWLGKAMEPHKESFPTI